MWRQFLKPSLLGVVLMLCLLFVLSVSLRGMGTSTVVAAPGESITQIDYTYGLPTMLRITTRGPSEERQTRTTTHVYWGRIAAVLAGAWLVSMPLGRWITGYARGDGERVGPDYRGWRHPAATVAYVLVGCAAVGAVCALAFEPVIRSGEPFATLAFAFFLLLMLLAVPITVIVMLIRRWRQRSRVARRGFAVEFAPPQV